MVPAPGIPGKHFMQVAIIVDDIASAAEKWTKTTGIGPFLHVPHVVLEEFS